MRIDLVIVKISIDLAASALIWFQNEYSHDINNLQRSGVKGLQRVANTKKLRGCVVRESFCTSKATLVHGKCSHWYLKTCLSKLRALNSYFNYHLLVSSALSIE